MKQLTASFTLTRPVLHRRNVLMRNNNNNMEMLFTAGAIFEI